MKKPALSVVMPVYNGEKYLNEAIDSVLNQTFSDFELIIINDGSRDSSKKIIQAYSDPRIRVIDNPVNKGISFCRNLGLARAEGTYLTWADCDDINLPERFAVQVCFLERNQVFGACGCRLLRFGGKKDYVFKAKKDPEQIKATLLFKPSVPNATVMLRLSKVRQYDLWYNEALPIAEDYDFVQRCSRCFPFTNIEKILYKYRDSETSIMKLYEAKEQESDELHMQLYANILGIMNMAPTEKDLKTHRLISSERMILDFRSLEECYKWLFFLKRQNQKVGVFDKNVFDRVLGEQLLFSCKKASRFGWKTFWYYLSKSSKSFRYVDVAGAMKLALRCAIRYDKF